MNSLSRPNKASEVIESIASLTDQRDQRSLELSLVSTLREMLPEAESWLLDVRSCVTRNQTPTLSHGNLATLPLEIVEQCAGMLEEDALITLEGHKATFLMAKLRGSEHRCRHLLILAQKQWPDGHIQLAQGMLRVYQNFIDLLYSSEIDTLTGLFNRRKLEVTLQNLGTGNQSERRGPPKGGRNFLAIMDLDRFKRINDTYGHLIGDEVLLVLANILRSTLRSSDQVFRYGGEEFVALFQDTDLHAMTEILERIRSNVEAHNFPLVGNITLSIGFAGLGPHDTPMEVLGRADRALYYAKDNGRNQVRQFEQLTAEGHIESALQSGSIELF